MSTAACEERQGGSCSCVRPPKVRAVPIADPSGPSFFADVLLHSYPFPRPTVNLQTHMCHTHTRTHTHTSTHTHAHAHTYTHIHTHTHTHSCGTARAHLTSATARPSAPAHSPTARPPAAGSETLNPPCSSGCGTYIQRIPFGLSVHRFPRLVLAWIFVWRYEKMEPISVQFFGSWKNGPLF